MSHLETLLAEYYDLKGYLVKRNIKVGKRTQGGWEMELDIIAYHPHDNHLLHIEASLDSDSWEIREKRFKKKFSAGKKYILEDVFAWLEKKPTIEQVAVLVSHSPKRNLLAGARIQSVDELMAEIIGFVKGKKTVSKNAIPEQYPLLRTLQLSHCGYYKAL